MKEYANLKEALADLFGHEETVIRRTSVPGGDINRAYALELSNGEKLFMKENRKENIGFFRAEAEGLKAMKETGAVKVPEVLALGVEASSSFLLLEHIEEGRKTGRSMEKLGRRLAGMHLAATDAFVNNGKYGFYHDNYIGAGTQINTPKDTWVDFFINCRLLPQVEKAQAYFDRSEKRRAEALFGKLDRYLDEPKKPSLLHGDLWAGNYMIDRKGEPWLIDPAVYVGHPEADLAMTELFGGFDSIFYDAYKETAGIDAGYRDRRDLYNLYHLLNHLNLFGGSYLYSVKSIMNRYV